MKNLLFTTLVMITLSSQDDPLSSELKYNIEFGAGMHIAVSDESLNSTSSLIGQDDNIGFANLGFNTQLGLGVQHDIGNSQFYWKSGLSVAYSNMKVDKIVSWTSYFINVFTYDEEKQTTIKAQYISGQLPLMLGRYLNKKQTVVLELGFLNQLRFLDQSKIKDVKIQTARPFVPGHIFIPDEQITFSEQKIKLEDNDYQWGILAKTQVQCFRLNNKPVSLGIAYTYYPSNRDFTKGHKLHSKLLLTLSTDL